MLRTTKGFTSTWTMPASEEDAAAVAAGPGTELMGPALECRPLKDVRKCIVFVLTAAFGPVPAPAPPAAAAIEEVAEEEAGAT